MNNNKKVFGKSHPRKNISNALKCTTCIHGFTQSNGSSSLDVKISCRKFAAEGMVSSPYKMRLIAQVPNMLSGTDLTQKDAYDSNTRAKYTRISLDKAIRTKFKSSRPNWCIGRC